VTCVYDDVTYVYDDVTYVYDDVTYVYDDVTYVHIVCNMCCHPGDVQAMILKSPPDMYILCNVSVSVCVCVCVCVCAKSVCIM